MTSSLSRSETADGRPAIAKAISRSSRIRCCTVAARSRSSSRALRCTSSTLSSRPVPRRASASSRRPSSWRHSATAAGGAPNVTPPPIIGNVTPVSGRPGAVVGSISCRSRVVACCRRPIIPGVAVSARVTHPRRSAWSPASVSMTVLPTPRAPVKIARRAGAPGPSSRDSANSSSTSSRPTSSGGVAPAVGRNGLRATFCTPYELL